MEINSSCFFIQKLSFQTKIRGSANGNEQRNNPPLVNIYRMGIKFPCEKDIPSFSSHTQYQIKNLLIVIRVLVASFLGNFGSRAGRERESRGTFSVLICSLKLKNSFPQCISYLTAVDRTFYLTKLTINKEDPSTKFH